MEGLKQHQVINKLTALISRIKLQSSEYSDLDVRVAPPNGPGRPFIIDVSQGRVSRQVKVDAKAVAQMQFGMVDAMLARELRSAMLTVSRLVHTKKN